MKSPIRPKLAQAEIIGRQLIHSWIEYGPKTPSRFPAENFPTPVLQELAEAVLDAVVNDGATDYSDVQSYLNSNEAPQRLSDELHECGISFCPKPENCGSIIKKLTEYHFELQHDILTQRLAKELAEGLPTAETRRQLEELEAGDYRPPPRFNPVDSFFYDGTKYYLDAGYQYIPMDQKSVARHLKNNGIKNGSSIDTILCEIQVQKFINFAGPLAGHPRGLHVAGGCRLLATTSPEIIQAAPGPWPTIRAVLEGLLLDETAGKVQLETFLGWLKFARESLTSNRRRPGQAIALAGPRGSGKSLLLDLTELALGGRRANPYAFFTGRTNFNADIAGAELLAVDDEAGSSDIRSRKTFAANIKSCLFSGSVRVEPKHRTAFVFRPVWRMLLALNDEPEALLVLPPITEDIADKLTLLRCHRRPLPMPAHTLEERDLFFAKLRSELPALLDWLEKWDVPGELTEERCGVTFYHHPELLASLHQLSPEGHLACLVDTLSAANGISLPWTGTASELKAVLCTNPTTSRDADKLLPAPNSTGTYLGRLEGSRVERLPMHNGIQRWRFSSSAPME